MYFTKMMGVCCTLTLMMLGLNAAVAQDCINAAPIACGGSVSGSTVGANPEVLPECGTTDGTGGGVWYTYTAPYDGTATYDLCNSDYDSKIRVWSGACEALECVGGNDDSFENCGSGGASFLSADIEEGVTYFIFVHGFSSNEGNFTLELTCEEAPVFECPLFEANIGDACDDGDIFTEGSTLDENCDCTGGTPIVFEGCTNAGLIFGNANPECNTTAQVLGAWAYEVSDITVVSGDDYIFSVSNPDYFVTIADDSNNVLTFGQETASWTATFDGLVFFYSHIGPGCPEESGLATSHTKIIERVCDTSGFDCPEELANIGDPCDDGDPFTEGTALDENCDCTGGTPIVFEGCTEGDFYLNLTPECSGSAALASGAWTFEYSIVTVEDGVDYTFTLSNPDYFVSVVTDEDSGTVLAFGQETTTWTADLDGTVRFYSHAGPDCPETSGSDTAHGRTVQAGVCNFDCSELEANIGDDCGENGTVSELCECVESLFDCPELEANIGDDCGEDGTVSEDCECVEPIANDDCANAALISCGGSVSGSTVGANPEVLADCGTSDGTGGGVWYTYTAPFDGTATYDLCNSDFDTKIRVWTGSCEALECVDGNDDLFSQCGSGNASYLEADIEAGVTYYILVHGFDDSEGNFTLDLTCEEAPVFDCPLFEANIGDPCDDGDIFTEGTTLDENCDCTGGTPIVFEGCTEGDSFGSFIPECGGPAGDLTGAWTFEYSTVSVENGIDYTFTLSNPDYYVSVVTDEDQGTVLAFGQETTTWTADLNGTVRFYSHAGPGCPETTGFTTSHTRTVQAGACNFDCPELEANIGDDCGENGTVSEDCECVEPCLSVGGELTVDGSNRICIGTGEPSLFGNAVLTGAAGENSIWVLTSGFLTVLATDATGPNFDFDALDPNGVYRIRHISYANDVDINEVLNNMNTEGCWEASNFIRVFVTAIPEPGTISLLNADNEFCPGEGPLSYAAVSTTGEDSSNFRFVLADENGDVIAIRTSGFFNLNNRLPGTYTIYRASWADGFNPSSSNANVGELGACQIVSNGVEVIVNPCTASALLSSAPNPTAGQSWVTFSVEEPQQVQVEVYDMAGRHIKTVFNQNAAGTQEYRMQFDGTSLPNGVYMYRMTTESEVIIDKFMIAR